MRILSICGQNIASLADRFEIDFTAEPLRSAGLFAITGETGAGKSSILDALCLALYGECPRLTMGGSSDEVPDAGGDPIRARDPRAVLRRGAAQGWAQVKLSRQLAEMLDSEARTAVARTLHEQQHLRQPRLNTTRRLDRVLVFGRTRRQLGYRSRWPTC